MRSELRPFNFWGVRIAIGALNVVAVDDRFPVLVCVDPSVVIDGARDLIIIVAHGLIIINTHDLIINIALPLLVDIE